MKITQLREAIDIIDENLVPLFVKRMETAGLIAIEKKTENLGVRDSEREREVLNKVTGYSDEKWTTYIKTLYQTIFSLSRTHQALLNENENGLIEEIEKALTLKKEKLPSKATVACQGTEGSYSQIAADKLFSLPRLLYFDTFENVINAVEKGMCHFGILPIENSNSGSVVQVYDLMKEHNFHIAKSIRVRISHCLLAKGKEQLSDIKEIWSHPQALEQCSVFLASLPSVKVHLAENTAVAARQVAGDERSHIGAIASSTCGALYNLKTLKQGVENHGNNYTRFICVTKDMEFYGSGNKISLMLSVPHTPGALYDLLSKFAALDINVSKIESRPLPGTDFEFIFYFDLEAGVTSEMAVNLMGTLKEMYPNFQFLGCYDE